MREKERCRGKKKWPLELGLEAPCPIEQTVQEKAGLEGKRRAQPRASNGDPRWRVDKAADLLAIWCQEDTLQ